MWYHVFLPNTNNLYTVIWFQVFLCNTNNLHTDRWFQVFLPNTDDFQTDLFDPLIETLLGTIILVREDLDVMTIKGHSTFQRDPELELHYWILFSIITRTPLFGKRS